MSDKVVWIEGALSLEMALVVCKGVFPSLQGILPLSGTDLGQIGVLVGLAVLGPKVSKGWTKLLKSWKKLQHKSNNSSTAAAGHSELGAKDTGQDVKNKPI